MDLKIDESIRKYINILIKNKDIYSLIVSAPPGLGKTKTTFDTLKEMGLKKNEHFIYVSGHVTPLKFYEMLGEARLLEKPRLIIADDVDSLLTNKISLGLLKSALSETDGERIISYHSRSIQEDNIRFTGKVIIITNNLSKNKHLLPLVDRSIVYNFELDSGALVEYIEDKIGEMYPELQLKIKLSIWEKIKRFTDSPRFSLRSIIRAFTFYEHDKENWYPLFCSSMKIT